MERSRFKEKVAAGLPSWPGLDLIVRVMVRITGLDVMVRITGLDASACCLRSSAILPHGHGHD